MSENAIDINGKLVKDFDDFDKMSKKEFVVRLERFYWSLDRRHISEKLFKKFEFYEFWIDIFVFLDA